MTMRGRVTNGDIRLPDAAKLSEGTIVEVTPLREHGSGSPGAAIVAAMEKLPKVPAAWVDDLERLIAEGRRPTSPPVDFPDAPEA